MTEADWTIAGLEEFIARLKKQHSDKYTMQRFSVRDIGAWADEHDVYSKNPTLTNGWRLGKYLKSHRGTLQKALGMFENGTSGNRTMYSVQ